MDVHTAQWTNALTSNWMMNWLRNQDKERTSEYLKLLTALFVVIPTHDL